MTHLNTPSRERERLSTAKAGKHGLAIEETKRLAKIAVAWLFFDRSLQNRYIAAPG
jgi:hypothetical protein